MTERRIDYSIYENRLLQRFEDAQQQPRIILAENIEQWSDIILKSTTRSPLAVLLTSFLKKSIVPQQDIRYHQKQMNGGYSGRGLDQKVTTDFLRTNNFPYMKSGSGWLTRSFESNNPYTMNYNAEMSSPKVKDAFLNLINEVQVNEHSADTLMIYFLQKLLEDRNRQQIELTVPCDLHIEEIIRILYRHFTGEYAGRGAARLPVLAIYSAYQQMIVEIERYKDYKLKPLESHTAADSRTGSIGDIEIENAKGGIFEAIEVKHDQVITREMVFLSYEKFKREEIDRYYLLTTFNDYNATNDVIDEIRKTENKHECQVIVNGVMQTLKYYLRLLRSTNDFIRNYVGLLETDPALLYIHKEKWNEIIEDENR